MSMKNRWLMMILIGIAMAVKTEAADWYLNADSSTDWTAPTIWWSTPEGSTGTHPASISSSDNFTSNGCLIRTPGTVPAVFGGASLTLRGADIAVKTSSTTQATTIGNLISYGGSIGNWTGNVQIVNVTNLQNHGNTTISSGGSTRGINLTIGTLQGNGDLTLTGDGTLLITLSSAKDFYGTTWIAGSGTAVSFQNALVSGGPLIVPGGVTVTLNAIVTFSGLSTNGTAWPSGTYNASDVGFLGTGKIIVKTPLSWYLHTNQSGNNWTTFTDWWTAVTGGTQATALSSNDDYFTNNFGLRTSGATIFEGATLNINGTTNGKLLLKAASTVKNLSATGTTRGISNASGSVQILNVGSFVNTTGNTNFDCTASNRGFNVNITRLRGAGNFTLLGYGGGTLSFGAQDASAYTGNIIMSGSSTGTLTFPSSLFSGGSLIVNSGNSVVVNAPVSFAGLTVNGVVKAAKTYATNELTGFSGTGTVTVTNRPPQMFGYNASGMQGDFYVVPSNASMAYFAGKGLTLVRVPFKWTRVQTSLGATLNAVKLADIDTVLARAAANGQMVILDMHSYGKYGSNYIGNSDGVVTLDHYKNVWQQLAAHFNASPYASSIYAYDIMNEPNTTVANQNWPACAQAAIDGIRAADTQRFIMVEGRSWASAEEWPKVNAGLIAINDPYKKLMFSAHCYFNSVHNDQYQSYDTEKAYPNMGVDQVAPFVEWCKRNKVYGHIGEFGVPSNDIRWNTVLQNFLQYLEDNGISATYWAGGFNPATYPLSIEPTSGQDSQQMSVLEEFGQ